MWAAWGLLQAIVAIAALLALTFGIVVVLPKCLRRCLRMLRRR